MKKVFPMAICVLLFMSSCGPSSVELTATADIALQQTQTAAPTKTPTPTLTPTSTPTATPTPLGGGGVIAFVSERNQDSESRIALYDIATGKTSHPTIQFMEEVNSTFGADSVSVSPDGTKLAFTQIFCPVREAGQKFHTVVLICSLRTSMAVTLPSSPRTVGTKDGRYGRQMARGLHTYPS